MSPYLDDGDVVLHLGDCVEVMAGMSAESVDAVVTDPPAGIAFMGRAWDTDRGGRDAWIAWLSGVLAECYRLMKPGAHALIWALPRTSHWTGMAIEGAGLEVRDRVTHLFGSGFPKSLDVPKAIDKRRDDREDVRRVCAFLRNAHAKKPRPRAEIDEAFGTKNVGGHWFTPNERAECPGWEQWVWLKEWLGFGDEMDVEVWRLNGRKGQPGEAWERREVVGEYAVTREFKGRDYVGGDSHATTVNITAPATPEAATWQGWGTALKPAAEDWWLARKPLSGTVAANVLAHGTGAINVDGCRVEAFGGLANGGSPRGSASALPMNRDAGKVEDRERSEEHPAGRWPANVVLSHTPECREVPDGPCHVHGIARCTICLAECAPTCPVRLLDEQAGELGVSRGSSRGVSRSWEGGPVQAVDQPQGFGDTGGPSRFFYTAKASTSERDGATHPTVKPLALMRWLVRLVTPPGGLVLDPFAGSGTTGLACRAEGFRCVLIEQSEEYAAMAAHRLRQLSLFGGAA